MPETPSGRFLVIEKLRKFFLSSPTPIMTVSAVTGEPLNLCCYDEPVGLEHAYLVTAEYQHFAAEAKTPRAKARVESYYHDMFPRPCGKRAAECLGVDWRELPKEGNEP